MTKPSMSSSPWILGAPQRGLALAILRISRLTSGETSSFLGVRQRDFQRQKRRKPARCQRTTVSGLTMTSASAQRDQIWERPTQNARSARRRRGRGADRWRVASCWRRARFSRASSARVRKAERRLASRFRSRASMAGWRMMPSHACHSYGFTRSPTGNEACG